MKLLVNHLIKRLVNINAAAIGFGLETTLRMKIRSLQDAGPTRVFFSTHNLNQFVNGCSTPERLERNVCIEGERQALTLAVCICM